MGYYLVPHNKSWEFGWNPITSPGAEGVFQSTPLKPPSLYNNFKESG